MTEQITDPIEFLKGGSASPNSKRKRDLEDSPEGRRKRSVTSSTPLLPNDAPNLSFIESAVEAAAAAASNMTQTNINIANAATVAALSALQQATQTTEAPTQQTVPVTNEPSPQQHTPQQHTPQLPQQQTVPQHQNVVPQVTQHTQTQHQDRAADPTNPANASTTAAAALGTMYPTLHVPTPTEQQFVAPATQQSDVHVSVAPQTQGVSVVAPPQQQQQQHVAIPNHTAYQDIDTMELARNHEMSLGHRKPAVGTPEWHKQRKDNHKEVERRRRETINEGINELAKIVPACEKNKGSILQKAVQFIQQLKANEASNIEKWTLEKLLTEQAIGELSQSNEKLKNECERLYRELETYKRVCQSAGLEIPGKTVEGSVPTTQP